MKFLPGVSEKLNFYVYALFDPKYPNIPFYIGKGKGNRVFEHMRGANIPEYPGELDQKMQLIRRICNRRNNGFNSVLHVIVRHGLTEAEALNVESALIDMVGWIGQGFLKNRVAGHGARLGFMTATEINNEYAPQKINPEEPAIVFKIEDQWSMLLGQYGRPEEIPDEEVYRACRRAWRIDMRRVKKARLVIAVARGVIRGVYVPRSWRRIAGINKVEFFRDQDCASSRDKYLNKSIATVSNRGAQNPVRYLNC